MLVVPSIIVGVFQSLSFVTMTYSALKIRSHIIKNHMQHINTNIMMLHMLSFFFYVTSGIGYYIMLFNFYRHFNDSKN